MNRIQIFVSGFSSDEKAAPFKFQAIELGKLIAKNGYNLSCGPGTGIARYVIDGFRSVENRHGNVIYHLPLKSEMDKVGEKVEHGADEIIETQYDYPMRNVYQISKSNAVILITGGDGSLQEAIVALSDYKIPVSGLKNSGNAVKALEVLSKIFTSWNDDLMICNDIDEMFRFICKKID